MMRQLSACGLAILLAGVVAPPAFALDSSELVQSSASLITSLADPEEKDALDSEDPDEAMTPQEEQAKYGDALSLTVRPLHGEEFQVPTRSNKPLQDLTAAIFEKMGKHREALTFKHNGRTLDRKTTPAKLRVSGGYVVEVWTKSLVDAKMKLAATEAGHRKDADRKREHEEHVKNKAAAEEQKRKDAEVAATLKKEEEARLARRADGVVALRFVNPHGGDDVVMTAKKAEPLANHLKLAMKRMRLPVTANFVLRTFRAPPRGVGPSDTPDTLHYREGDKIHVRV